MRYDLAHLRKSLLLAYNTVFFGLILAGSFVYKSEVFDRNCEIEKQVQCNDR